MAERKIDAVSLEDASSYEDYLDKAQRRGFDFELQKSGVTDEMLRRGWSVVAPYFLRPNIAPDGPLPAMPKIERDDDGNIVKATANPQLAQFLSKAWNINSREDLLKSAQQASQRTHDKAYEAGRSALQEIRQLPVEQRAGQTSVLVNVLSSALPEAPFATLESEAARLLRPLLNPDAEVLIPAELPRSLAGFYFAAAVRQLNLGAGAGLIKPSEVRPIIVKCVLGIARAYDTWDEYVAALIYGEAMLASKIGEHFRFIFHNAAALLTAPGSPWVELPLHTETFPPIKSNSYEEIFSSMQTNAQELPVAALGTLSDELRSGWSLQAPYLVGSKIPLDAPATYDEQRVKEIWNHLENQHQATDAASLRVAISKYLDNPDHEAYRAVRGDLQEIRTWDLEKRQAEGLEKITASLGEKYASAIERQQADKQAIEREIGDTAVQLHKLLSVEDIDLFLPKTLPSSLAGWRIAQGVRLAAMGYATELFSEDEANEFAAHARKLAQDNHTNWRDFGDGFLVGRLCEHGQVDSLQQRMMASTAGALASKQSPWNELAFN
ncbi:DUF1266 domain-containing protein [Corynebacterium sp.]|uniref:DUF1266 domain-containing protein n=1 Tax=Corynebacterium sp. TaxID=1720 RepID=UPI0027B88955|nr:DUF1266 domain-containing protein [Corynebacterium sp.]